MALWNLCNRTSQAETWFFSAYNWQLSYKRISANEKKDSHNAIFRPLTVFGPGRSGGPLKMHGRVLVGRICNGKVPR